MAKKPPYARINGYYGYDLMVERDSGNEIRVLTGNEELSRDFWQNLRDLSNSVLEEMKAPESSGNEIITI